MLSYNWGLFKEDIRTLAQAMYNSGIGVWIDAIKLISGGRLPQDTRRAVNEVNFVVVFLTPAYLKSANCCIEFGEAIKNVGKLHVHVLDWGEDETVHKAVKFLIDDVKLARSHISAHGVRTGVFRKIFNTFRERHRLQDASTEVFIQELKTEGRGWIKLGNVYIRQDCLETGTDGSAIPWILILFLTAALSPIVDIIFFVILELDLTNYANSCANSFRTSMSANTTVGQIALLAICDNFYEKTYYLDRALIEKNGVSAFQKSVVNSAFKSVYFENQNLCSGMSQTTTIADITDSFRCVNVLNLWFESHRDSPETLIWALIFAITICFLITLLINFESIINTTKNVPAALRPLLAFSNLNEDEEQEAKEGSKTGLVRLFTKKRKVLHEGEKIDLEALLIGNDHTPRLSRSPMIRRGTTRGYPHIPQVYVNVHGDSLIANNLRNFLHNLGRSLPRDSYTDAFVRAEGDFSKVKNVDLINGLAWVNVFVISNFRQLQTFYKLNLNGQVDSDVSVVIIDHQVARPHENHEEILIEDKPETNWIYTVVYIETRADSGKKGSLPTPELAEQIMVVEHFAEDERRNFQVW
ncbi:hypothetical protein HK098_007934 [Nowakowskiella sp. JEL0407]|nr:hypothetical protein HK098_007934 [Nowakowskiella sp. JEL0407]